MCLRFEPHTSGEEVRKHGDEDISEEDGGGEDGRDIHPDSGTGSSSGSRRKELRQRRRLQRCFGDLELRVLTEEDAHLIPRGWRGGGGSQDRRRRREVMGV
ncbi:hypothetical protein NQZ68_019908 [Dissostichus eleginoides]|uniref:Vacuolar membrane-associated protein IML1 n=1 Tax=Dissostichus eleginoides TaxID=100907 RepID=A0AAD9CNQ1_DISEL|nr:hypothetical protein NQZ68_019908 [Dissostichus eleginoides]KAK1905442.1 Vacuolar membrane-associated protein IML1 [Dissostichus eleginoides]